MAKFKVGDQVKVNSSNTYGPEFVKYTGPIANISVGYTNRTRDLYYLDCPPHGKLCFYEEELDLVISSPDTKETAYARAVSLKPDGTVQDHIALAEWLMKND